MKIIVCGIPPAQARALEQRYPGHDVIVIGAQDPLSRYLSHMVVCDLCIVNTRLMSHKAQSVMRTKMGRALTLVNGPSSAVAAINNFLGAAA